MCDVNFFFAFISWFVMICDKFAQDKQTQKTNKTMKKRFYVILTALLVCGTSNLYGMELPLQ